jgi:phasin family protein
MSQRRNRKNVTPSAVVPETGAPAIVAVSAVESGSVVTDVPAIPVVDDVAIAQAPEFAASDALPEPAPVVPDAVADEAPAIDPAPQRILSKGLFMTNFFAPETFQSMFADAGFKGQEAVAKSQKLAEDMLGLARGNVEAMVESTRIATDGLRGIGQQIAEQGREGVELASQNLKALGAAKSPTEFFQLQQEAAKTQFDRMVAEGSKLTEQWVKLMGEAVQPLQNRASLAAQRVQDLAA